ncbi:MAG: DUF6515 family protein [Pseudomonadales bacterium]|nr:DUF6515 family protein [Pseudomonadales bacterium]
MKRVTIAASLGLIMSLAFTTAEAHPRNYAHGHHNHVVVQRGVVVRPAPVANLVARTVGAVFDTLPANHVRVVHAGRTYYLHDGVYYARQGARYVVVKPVAGIRVTSLPRGYTTVRIDGRTHYRFNSVTYRRVNNYYVVV